MSRPTKAFSEYGVCACFLRILPPLVFALGTGCQPFHPRDPIRIPEIAEESARTVDFPMPQIQIEMAAQDSLEQSLEIFDADLPRAGIYAVWVRIRNDSAHALNLDSSHIYLTRQGVGYAQLIPPDQIMELLYKSYRTRIYSPFFRAQLENWFEEMRLKHTGVPSGQERSGYLFFRMNSKEYGLLKGARLRWSDIKSANSPELLEIDYTFPGP